MRPVPYLVSWFQENFPEWAESMHNSTHHFVDGNNFHGPPTVKLNPYHLEGDVWSHLMMVMKVAEINEVNRIVQMAALCHDLGKPASRVQKQEKERASFHGHGGISSYMAFEVMKKWNEQAIKNKTKKGETIEENEMVLYSEKDMQIIIELVNWHQNLFDKMETPFRLSQKGIMEYGYEPHGKIVMLLELMTCDSRGRYSNDDRPYNDYLGLERQFTFSQDWLTENLDITTLKTRKITVYIGPPGAGKSTHIDIQQSIGEKQEVLSRDDIIMSLAPSYMDYNQAWATVDQKEVDSALMKRFRDLIKERKNIIVDMTNMSKKSRRKWLNGLPKEYDKRAFVVMASYDDIFKRNRNRKGKILDDEVIHRMMSGFHAPLHSEFDNITWYLT